MNVVSDSIKKLRRQKGMTQDELAEKLSVTRQAVSNWETGKTQPDIDTLTKLAEIFEVSTERVIYGKERKHWHFAVNFNAQECINMGAVLAMIISYTKWKSIGWALLHGCLNWAYVIYYMIKY